MRPLTLASLLICFAFAGPAIAEDSCRVQLPKSLGTAVAAAFPGFRLPLQTDNSAEDSEFNRQSGGKGCLGVAVADFNGDRADDFLLGLTAKGQSGSAKAVVALSSKSGWRFKTIRSWTEDSRSSLYVSAVKPGKYERTEALEGPLEPGERQTMRCKYSGALVGAMESTGVVYCFESGRWPYVWVSD